MFVERGAPVPCYNGHWPVLLMISLECRLVVLLLMSCVKFLKNHFIVRKRHGFRLFRFVTDNFCLRTRTSCNIHCHCLEDVSATGETFSQKGRDRHEGGGFFTRGANN